MESNEGKRFDTLYWAFTACFDSSIWLLNPPFLSYFQHFFGGAMGVFTTRTLLNSVGVAQSRAASGAVAINWILKVCCPAMNG
jgi:hypothetical protein